MFFCTFSFLGTLDHSFCGVFGPYYYLSMSDSYCFLQTVKQSTNVGLHNNFCKRPVIPMIEHHTIVNGLNDCLQQHWRNIVLDQMYKSLSDCEGGIRGCIRAALLSCPEVDHTTTIKVHAAATAALLGVCVVIAMTASVFSTYLTQLLVD